MRPSLFASRRSVANAARGLAPRPLAPARIRRMLSPATTNAREPPSIAPRYRQLHAGQPREISCSSRQASPSSAAAAPESESEPEPSQPRSPLSETTTHYTFFPQTLPQGPPPQGPFVIDTRALRREFLVLQSRAHPDLAPQAEKSTAQALSARINEAYKVLSSPLLRAHYLLSLRGEDVGLGEEGKTDDPELLELVMEAHYAVGEAETEEELEGIRAENEDRIRESEARLEEAFRKDDLAAAKEEAIKLKYWVAIREKIHEWEVQKEKEHEHEQHH